MEKATGQKNKRRDKLKGMGEIDSICFVVEIFVRIFSFLLARIVDVRFVFSVQSNHTAIKSHQS